MERPDETTNPLDDPSAPHPVPVRPTRLLSHMLTAAVLCLITLFVTHRSRSRYEPDEIERLIQIEIALVLYGGTCAVVSVARPRTRAALTPSDQLAIGVCFLLFALTALSGLLVPRLNG